MKKEIACCFDLLTTAMNRVYLIDQLPIFSRSSLRLLTEVLVSLTTENREMSSENSLHSLLRPSDKSLIYIKNNKGPRIHPWGTPALTSAQEEHWPFKTTVCFLLRIKSRKMFMTSPLIPFWRSLKIRPSCYTLSKAFEISRNISRTSYPLSNVFKISWLIVRIWLMQELPDLNPDRLRERRLLSVRKSYPN